MSFTVPPGPFFDLQSLGLPQTQQDLLTLWLTSMQSAFNGYNPSSADLEYVQATVFASQASDVAQLCNSGATELFRQFGTKLLNIAYLTGTPAQAVVTVTAKDNAGYTLPQGTQMTLTLGGTQVGFQTASILTIPNGNTTGNVIAVAVQSGSSFNGAGAPAMLISQISWVTGITVVSGATGGVDQEDDTAYVNRLAGATRLLGPQAITAEDFALQALNFQPTVGTDQQEVGRATFIDGYNPNNLTTGNENTVAVAVTDANGVALNNDTMTALQTFLNTRRLICTNVYVTAPSYTNVYVGVTAVAATGNTTSTVQANIQSTLLAYLNPTSFGVTQGSLTGWSNTTTVYLSKLTAIVEGTAGVDHVPAGGVFLGLGSNPSNNTQDLVLPGAFPLPTSSTGSIPLGGITVTSS